MVWYNRLIPLLLIQAILHLAPVHSQRDDFIISGYLPDHRLSMNLNASSPYLTDVMLYSLSPETIMEDKKDGCCVSKEHYDFIRRARAYKKKEQKKKLGLWLTVGGAGRSEGFNEVVNGNVQAHAKFVDDLVKLCKREQLDGIDLYNESMESMDDWKKYIKFLAAVAPVFKDHPTVHKKIQLSVSVHVTQILPKEICEAVDRVHVRTYDIMPGDAKGKPGHHAKLFDVKEVMKQFIKVGCPPEKLVMGIPAYARHTHNSSLKKTYAEVVDEYFGDKKLSALDGYHFDTPGEVRLKVRFAKEAGLGGIFFWELGQDNQDSEYEGGELLQTAKDEL